MWVFKTFKASAWKHNPPFLFVPLVVLRIFGTAPRGQVFNQVAPNYKAVLRHRDLVCQNTFKSLCSNVDAPTKNSICHDGRIFLRRCICYIVKLLFYRQNSLCSAFTFLALPFAVGEAWSIDGVHDWNEAEGSGPMSSVDFFKLAGPEPRGGCGGTRGGHRGA